ncbi:MAG: VOC family protein, partial [Acidimicrobiales bacterium]
GYQVTRSSPFFAELTGGGSVGPRFMFVMVPEPKTAKNRVHLDLGSVDLDTEVERVLGLGATLVGRYQEWGATWVTFTDPEGNEFCIGLHAPGE